MSGRSFPNTPPPSRAEGALDTSPPEGVEEGRELANPGSLPRPLQGERWPAQQVGEGETRPRPTRRRSNATNRARSLRHGNNQAEALLWLELKAKKLGGHHFVRQLPIGPYFADFCCRKQKLVVEIDGSQHADSAYDRKRDDFFRSQGFSTLRFWNHDVLKHRTAVCETILAALDGRLAESVVAHDLRFVFAPTSQFVQPLQ
ncbi:MAG: endonuclease domain-containing protein [Rhizobiaceae bacterium]|nr:endonuclease domain-containing protein [Rhizobiaceae bacterium]